MAYKEILIVEDLHCGYIPSLDVLNGVSIRVTDKNIVSIIGPNGAGKSTLLKAIFGLLKAGSGKIYFQEKDVTNHKPIERLKMGLMYIPQGRCNFPKMSVHENLEMAAYIRTDSKIQEDITEVYRRFPILKERKKQKAGLLSGGEQQMMEIGMSLMLKPKLIMLDEPSLGLEPKKIQLVFQMIKELNEGGSTIIVVEQNVRKALEFSHYSFVLALGKNRFEGTPSQVLGNPEIRTLYLGG